MKSKIMFFIIICFIFSLAIMIIHDINNLKSSYSVQEKNEKIIETYEEKIAVTEINHTNTLSENIKIQKKDIDDWRLVLVNSENEIPDDYQIDLVSIDKGKQVDSRIVDELLQMLQDLKSTGIDDIWVQSAYRSKEYQEEVYNNRINRFINDGLSEEEAQEMTAKIINKPGTSEHNLGLSVDLNYVSYDFENTEAFEWLQNNAENYGFVLRYSKEKEEITKINYEPWHWRYVGVEHAKKMNELDMCLEEYVEYLSYNY